MFDAQTQGRGNSDGPRWASSGSASTMRKASSATNIVDDLSSIFGGSVQFILQLGVYFVQLCGCILLHANQFYG